MADPYFDEDMDAAGSSSIMGTSRDGLYRYNTDIMKSRGISEITIQTTEEQSSKWDEEVLETNAVFKLPGKSSGNFGNFFS